MSNNSGSKQSSPSFPNLESLLESISSLRDKNDFLEDELNKLKADQVSLDLERSRLLREFEVLDEKLSKSSRELGFRKEAEENAIKRYARSLEYCRDMDEKMEVLKRSIEVERGEFLGKLSVLKDEFIERDVELKELRKRNKLSEDELTDLRGRDEDLGKELGKFEAALRDKDEEIGDLRRRNEELLERIRVLENEKLEIVNDKDGRIEELNKKKTELMAMDKMKEERIFKIESDAATYCWLLAKRGVMFGRSLNEKILSMVDNTLLEEQGKQVNIAGNLDAGDKFRVEYF